ncbi:MAG: flippase [Candidatus Omnitrophica bacterium]|nr:flippase [Candidatus Omnitrophota bacterium]
MQEQSISKKIIRNVIFNIIGRFWGILVVLFLTPYIIGHIGIERFGIWALIEVLTGYFGLLDFGVGYSFRKYIAEFYAKRDYKRINEVVNTGFIFYSIFAATVIILAFFNIDFLLSIFKISPNLHKEVSFVFLVGIIIFGFNSAFSSFFVVREGLQRMDITNKIAIIVSIPKIIGVVFFLESGYGLPGLMLNSAIMFLISSIINFVAVFKLLPELVFNPFLSSWRVFKRLFAFGFKIQVSKFAGLFHFQMDKFLLAYFLNVSFVTFYAVASQVASKIMELPMMIITVIEPAASELDAKLDRQRLIELYSRSMKYVILSALPISLLVVLLAKPFIELWLGQGYDKAILTLQILVGAYFINLLTGPGFCILNGIGKPQYAMRSSIVAAVLNAVLSIVLVIKIGYFGAVFGTASAMLIAAFYFLFMFYQVSAISFWNSFSKICLKPLMVGLLSFLLGSIIIKNIPEFNWAGLVISGLAYLALFLALIFITGYIDSYDKVLINRYTKLRVFKI